MKHKNVVDKMLEVLGGKENISNYEHCATRMRIVLKDDDVVDKDKVEEVPESKGYFYSTGQHQFIFGTGKVNEVMRILKKRWKVLKQRMQIQVPEKTPIQI
jgi:Phosphotransferase system IIB components